jgi:hypothetical protein
MGMVGPKEKKQKRSPMDTVQQFIKTTQAFQKTAAPVVEQPAVDVDRYESVVKRNRKRQ